MKNILLAIFSSLILISASAQTQDLYRDDFNKKNDDWKTFYDDGASCEFDNGTLKFECKGNYISYRFWRSIPISKRSNFVIEAKLKQVSGSNEKTYGIVWGASGWQNSYSFDVMSNGSYKIWGYKNKKKFTIKKETKDKSAVNGYGQYNTLKIERKGTKMYYYINGKEVHSGSSRENFGDFIGFKVDQGVSAAADFIVVSRDRSTINLVSETVSKYSKTNMGLNINSPFSEIAPVISPDGNTLYIARSGHPKTTGSDKSKYDIWYSTRNPDGSWNKAKQMESPLNNTGDNVVIAVAPDNNTLLVETLYNSDGSFKSDQGISVTYRTASGWSVPEKVNVKNYYNRDIYESFCPTGNRQVIVMSVKRDDSFGEKDLYVSFRESDGSYSEPKNMGPVLNSFDNEGTPYIAPDNKTLYFYSYTEPGYGSADIFVSKRLDDTWTNWSQPKNLGTKINTPNWDVYYTVSAKGDYAYLVSTKGSYGNEDIFTIKLRDEEKPDPVVLVTGKVLNKISNRAIGTKIEYKNIETGKIEGLARSNPQTGEYKIVLPYGAEYEITTRKDGFYSLVESFDLKNVSDYKEVEKDLYMIPVKEEKTILLKNVHFYAAKDQLTPESYDELNQLVKTMKDNPSMKIEVHGHTETRAGYEDKLMALSERRAAAVRVYLVRKGIESHRIRTKAFGGTKPIASNSTEKGRKQNRRVEFKIISQ